MSWIDSRDLRANTQLSVRIGSSRKMEKNSATAINQATKQPKTKTHSFCPPVRKPLFRPQCTHQHLALQSHIDAECRVSSNM